MPPRDVPLDADPEHQARSVREERRGMEQKGAFSIGGRTGRAEHGVSSTTGTSCPSASCCGRRNSCPTRSSRRCSWRRATTSNRSWMQIKEMSHRHAEPMIDRPSLTIDNNGGRLDNGPPASSPSARSDHQRNVRKACDAVPITEQLAISRSTKTLATVLANRARRADSASATQPDISEQSAPERLNCTYGPTGDAAMHPTRASRSQPTVRSNAAQARQETQHPLHHGR